MLLYQTKVVIPFTWPNSPSPISLTYSSCLCDISGICAAAVCSSKEKTGCDDNRIGDDGELRKSLREGELSS